LQQPGNVGPGGPAGIGQTPFPVAIEEQSGGVPPASQPFIITQPQGGTPIGSPRPGMVIPVPVQQGQPGQQVPPPEN
jgi:hypothetical protein